LRAHSAIESYAEDFQSTPIPLITILEDDLADISKGDDPEDFVRCKILQAMIDAYYANGGKKYPNEEEQANPAKKDYELTA